MENNIVGFTLVKVATKQFATFEHEETEKAEINLDGGIEFGIDREHKLIACFSKFQYFYNNLPFIVIEISCEFRIEDSSWLKFESQDSKSLTVPVSFLRHLATIAVGTTRGVLHAKTENTVYNRFLLPTVNVNQIIQKDETFEYKD